MNDTLPANQTFDSPSPPIIANASLSKGGAISALVPTSLDDTFRLAKALAKGGDMVPKHFQNQPEAIMAAILRGMEIGLAPMQALSNIAVINGRASLWGDALPALMQRAGHQLDCIVTGDGDNMVATATLIRGDTGQTIVRTFSAADAKSAGLWGKPGPWQQYKPRMMSMRARTLACRDGAADALMGLQVVEEAQDMPAMRDVTPPRAPAGQNLAQRLSAAPASATTDAVEVLPPEPEDAPPEPPHWTAGIDTEQAFPGDPAFTEGVKAFAAGIRFTMNPHKDNPDDAAHWAGGWAQAERAKQ